MEGQIFRPAALVQYVELLASSRTYYMADQLALELGAYAGLLMCMQLLESRHSLVAHHLRPRQRAIPALIDAMARTIIHTTPRRGDRVIPID